MKSIIDGLERLKKAIDAIFEVWFLKKKNSVNFSLQKSAKNHENQNSDITKTAVFELPQLISRKICVAVKFWNFQTVTETMISRKNLHNWKITSIQNKIGYIFRKEKCLAIRKTGTANVKSGKRNKGKLISRKNPEISTLWNKLFSITEREMPALKDFVRNRTVSEPLKKSKRLD